MAKPTSIKEAIARFEKEKNVVAAVAERARHATAFQSMLQRCNLHVQDVEHLVLMRSPFFSQVDLTAQVPPIEKMDAGLNALKACKYSCQCIQCYFAIS